MYICFIAGDNEKRDTESISSESAKDSYKKSTRKISHSGTLWEVKETEKELKYRAKNFKGKYVACTQFIYKAY